MVIETAEFPVPEKRNNVALIKSNNPNGMAVNKMTTTAKIYLIALANLYLA